MSTDELLSLLQENLEPLGLEVYLFKSIWYNQKVAKSFKFQLCNDTICAVVISTPFFFEKAFIPYVKSIDKINFTKDPIDSCIAHQLDKLKNHPLLGNLSMTILYDYEVLPSRRPKVLVQTAAHVAGAAFYYKRCDVNDLYTVAMMATDENAETKSADTERNKEKDPWDEKEKIFGVCIHPEFGGWFAIRAVIIFNQFVDPNLKYTPPEDCVPTREARIRLLDSFNKNWKDWSYRDIIPVKARYSELQKEYFSTLPENRNELLSKYFQK